MGSLCKKYSDDDKEEMVYRLFAYNVRPRLYSPLAILFFAGLGKNIDETNDFVLQKVVGKADLFTFRPIVT